MNFKKSKRGAIIGSFMGMFIATIAVVIILLVFVFISGAVKIVSDTKEGLRIDDESVVGVGDVFPYMDTFLELQKFKYSEAANGKISSLQEDVDNG